MTFYKNMFVKVCVNVSTLASYCRSFGGEVSWSETQAVGATYPETDEKITHQIVDRPSMEKQFLSRYNDCIVCWSDLYAMNP